MLQRLPQFLFLATIACFVLFSETTRALEIIEVGDMPNQILESSQGLLTINSGFGGQAGISLIQNGTSKNLYLEKNSNPYSGLFLDEHLYISLNSSDELIEISKTSLELEDKDKLPFTRVHQPSEEITGGESLQSTQSYIVWTFSNLLPDMSFLPGTILIFEKGHFQEGPKWQMNLSSKNPKSLLALDGDKIAVSTGTYGKDDGKILIIDLSKLSEEKTQSEEKLLARGALKSYAVGGTPGSLAFNGSTLYSCDSEYSKFYLIEESQNKVAEHALPFQSCASMEVSQKALYFTNLYGGVPGLNASHLYVFSKNELRELCHLELLSKKQKSPQILFPSDIALIENGTKLAVALSETHRLALLELDNSGVPKDCKQ